MLLVGRATEVSKDWASLSGSVGDRKAGGTNGRSGVVLPPM